MRAMRHAESAAAGSTGALRLIGRVLWVIAALLTLTTVVSVLLDGVRFRLGPIPISATDPPRVALQTALVWLLAVIVVPRTRRRKALVMASLLAVLIAAVADSFPRRVGDGGEYLAMAINLSQARPPALSVDDKRALSNRLAATPGFEVSPLDQPLVGADGRQDFPHFWLYPLFVAPLVAAFDAIGVHPNYAFTAFNIALVLLLAWSLVQDDHAAGAALLVAGPLIWWVDKAHAEVFLVVTIAGAVLLAARRPAMALVAAGLATAQNPAAAVVFACVALFTVADPRRTRRVYAGLAAAAAIAAIPLVYYFWHLGTWSPLGGHVDRSLPALRAFFTPLLDPNLGLLIHAPVLVLLAVLGLSAQTPARRVLSVALVLGLLFAFSRPLNVNHGGTPGMSRYALWLLACLLPLVADGARRLERRRPVLMAIALTVTVSMSWFTFRPDAADRGGSTPSFIAGMLWSRWPALDNPLPEVFAERVTGVDGMAPVPAATPGCDKVLVRGDGSEAWWPLPCEPREAPRWCIADDALCYVNGESFAAVPRQPGFIFDPVPDRSWNVRHRGALPALLARLGDEGRVTSPGRSRRFDGGHELYTPYMIEGASGIAIWIRPAVPAESFLRIRVRLPSDVEIRHAVSGELVSVSTLPVGDHEVPLPFDERVLVVVTDTP